MKDTIITVKEKRREIILLLISFIVSNIINVVGIIVYKTSIKEIFTELPRVFILTFVLYFIGLAIRVGICFIKLISHKIKQK